MSDTSTEAPQRRVRYDAETQARAIQQELEGVLLALQQPTWRAALGEDRLAQLARDIHTVRDRMAQPFTLLVVGDFKRGKSTLVNALLGRRLVTMDVAPETVAITEIHHGPEVAVEARLLDGGRVDLEEADLPSARLGPILENLPGPVDIVRITAPLPWLEGLAVVDSPGTGDLLFRFDARVQAYLPRADAVVHVVSAVSPLSESERSFLRLFLHPLELSKVVFVVNQTDLLRTPQDADRVVDRVAVSVRPLFPDSPVLGVSALRELDRQTHTEAAPDSRFAQSFAALRALMDERILLDKHVVKNERGAREAEALVRRTSDDLGRLRAALNLDRDALQEAMGAASDRAATGRQALTHREEQIRAAIHAMGEQAVSWMDGVVTRIELDTLPQLGPLSHEDVQKHFPFFLAESLRDALEVCLGTHQGVILALAHEASEEAAENIHVTKRGQGVDAAANRAGFQTPPWTVYDHMHVVGLALFGMTLGMSALFAGLFDHVRGHETRAGLFREAFVAALPQLREQVARATRKAYADLATEVTDRLRTAHEADLQRIADELAHAKAMHDRGDGRAEEATRALDEAQRRLARSAANLADVRHKLRDAVA